MIVINGSSNTNGGWWGNHLQSEKNDRVEVCETRGFALDTIDGVFQEMGALAKGTNVKNHFYQANINPQPGEELTPAQWKQAVDRLEKNLGLTDQPRMVVEHEKNGRTHRHVIWSRIDAETGRAISDSLDYKQHQKTSRELEITFDLARGKSVLEPGRDGPRPERAPKPWETQRANEGRLNVRDIGNELTDLWRASDSGRAFVAAVEERGYRVARGDSRVFVILDHVGDDHSLARRLHGVNTAGVRAHMADVDLERLPSVDEGRTAQRAAFIRDGVFDRAAAVEAWRNRPSHEAERTPDHAPGISAKPDPRREQGQTPQPRLGREAQAIHEIWTATKAGPDFAAALQESGRMIVQVSAADAQASLEAQAKARAEGKYIPVLREGELAAVNRSGHVTAINERTTGDSREAIDARLGGADRPALMNVADGRDLMREIARQEFSAKRQAEQPRTHYEEVVSAALYQQRSTSPFGAQLDREGITIARATRNDIEAFKYRHKERQEEYKARDYQGWLRGDKPALKRDLPQINPGDLFAVARNGSIHRLNPHRVDVKAVEAKLAAEGRTFSPVEVVRVEKLGIIADREAAKEQRHADYWAAKESRQQDNRHTMPGPTGRATSGPAPAKAAAGMAQTLGKLADIVADILSFGATASTSGPRNPQLEALEKIEAQERAGAALDRMAESLRRGETVRPEDIRNLTQEQLVNLRDTGDAGLLAMIKRHEEDRERDRDRSYGWER